MAAVAPEPSRRHQTLMVKSHGHAGQETFSGTALWEKAGLRQGARPTRWASLGGGMGVGGGLGGEVGGGGARKSRREGALGYPVQASGGGASCALPEHFLAVPGPPRPERRRLSYPLCGLMIFCILF